MYLCIVLPLLLVAAVDAQWTLPPRNGTHGNGTWPLPPGNGSWTLPPRNGTHGNGTWPLPPGNGSWTFPPRNGTHGNGTWPLPPHSFVPNTPIPIPIPATPSTTTAPSTGGNAAQGSFGNNTQPSAGVPKLAIVIPAIIGGVLVLGVVVSLVIRSQRTAGNVNDDEDNAPHSKSSRNTIEERELGLLQNECSFNDRASIQSDARSTASSGARAQAANAPAATGARGQ